MPVFQNDSGLSLINLARFKCQITEAQVTINVTEFESRSHNDKYEQNPMVLTYGLVSLSDPFCQDRFSCLQTGTWKRLVFCI